MRKLAGNFGSYGEAIDIISKMLAETIANYDKNPIFRLRLEFETLLKCKEAILCAWESEESQFAAWLDEQEKYNGSEQELEEKFIYDNERLN